MNHCKKCNIHRDNAHDRKYLAFKLTTENKKLEDFPKYNLNAIQSKYLSELINRIRSLNHMYQCNHSFTK